MRCPLPIDWLDSLEGAASEERTFHLRDCRPCQLLVEQLRRDLPDLPQLRLVRAPDADTWPRWREHDTVSPSFGEIWWGTPPPGSQHDLVRVPLLLLSESWQEGGRSWFDVVPLSTDIDSATPLDLLIRESETDLRAPWRAHLRHQTVAERSALETCIGKLTAPGRRTVQEALAGRPLGDRFGSAMEEPVGSRLDTTAEIEDSVRQLGRSYALMQEAGALAHGLSRVLSFEMHHTAKSVGTMGQLSLAAASSAEEREVRWEVDVTERGRLVGRLEHRAPDDELLFVVEETTSVQVGPGVRAWIVAWSKRQDQALTSAPFLPAAGMQVSLGRDQGIFPQEVTRVELRLSDEC